VRADLKRATRPRAFNPLAVFNEWLATCIAVASKEKRNNMSKVIIEKPETASEMSVLNDEANTINGRIRERAFELFEESGEARGNDSENWIRAEASHFHVFSMAASILATARCSVAPGAMIKSLLRRHHVRVLAFPELKSRLLNSAGKRKRHRPGQSRFESGIHRVQTRRGEFDGLSARQKRNARYRRGDDSQETSRSWRRPLVSTSSCFAHVSPGSTILGFRIMPSSVTRCA
jgi:hypothetical protein